MKKTIISAVLAAACMCVLSAGASAESASYALTGLDLTISLPSDMQAFTRGMAADDPVLSQLGITPSEIDGILEESSQYLDAYSADGSSYEIIVSCKSESDTDGVSDIRNIDLEDFVDAIKNSSADSVAVSSAVPYHGANMDFAIAELTVDADGEDVLAVSYVTLFNSSVFYLTLRSYTGEITDQMRAIVKSAADSIVFPPAPAAPAASSSSGSGWKNVLTKCIEGAAAGAIISLIGSLFSKKKKAARAVPEAGGAPVPAVPAQGENGEAPAEPALGSWHHYSRMSDEELQSILYSDKYTDEERAAAREALMQHTTRSL